MDFWIIEFKFKFKFKFLNLDVDLDIYLDSDTIVIITMQNLLIGLVRCQVGRLSGSSRRHVLQLLFCQAELSLESFFHQPSGVALQIKRKIYNLIRIKKNTLLYVQG